MSRAIGNPNHIIQMNLDVIERKFPKAGVQLEVFIGNLEKENDDLWDLVDLLMWDE